ncbi:response regulator transcription factor [Nocardioides nematodiphilus]|uniref:response regulator transcription factor n=1 Tax=Nocardioides nematodiphilus TaxID=2849669 RepID=UPI001CD9F5E8|nr:response regulator transcription factor [Nocardioides nematodiphilus]MCA1983263.1 response regulator transcription factor [Nocardioides nematodiphilus]
MRPGVAVVDDHEVVALAVAGMIAGRDDLRFVAHARSVAELLDREPGPVDLVVLDLNLRDGTDPADNAERLHAWGAQVLVLTSGENPYLIRQVSHAPVQGILRKSAPAEEIVAAIVRAAAGEPTATTEWAAALDSDPDLEAATLTAREREVLALYASGLGAKAVARQLFISEHTVDDHIRRIRHAYGQLSRPANTKVELYQRGVEDGFLPIPQQQR